MKRREGSGENLPIGFEVLRASDWLNVIYILYIVRFWLRFNLCGLWGCLFIFYCKSMQSKQNHASKQWSCSKNQVIFIWLWIWYCFHTRVKLKKNLILSNLHLNIWWYWVWLGVLEWIAWVISSFTKAITCCQCILHRLTVCSMETNGVIQQWKVTVLLDCISILG